MATKIGGLTVNAPSYPTGPAPTGPSIKHDVGQLFGHFLNAMPGYSSLGSNITNPKVNYLGIPNPYGPSNPAPSPVDTTKDTLLNQTPPQQLPNLPDSTGGQQFTDTSAARDQTLGSINGLDQILANKLAEAEAEYQKVMQGYNEQDANNQQEYDQNVSTNEGNREAQHQAALLAAAQGGRGLYATLASIGALGGTGKLLANRAVAGEANADLGAADKTFTDNATNLESTFKKLKQQEDQRKLDANSNLEANKQADQYDIADQRQSLWKDMADLWTKAGNNTESANALAKAGSYTNDKVANTRPVVAKYAPADLQFSAPQLKSYLAGANDMTVHAADNAGGAPINGAIFTSTKKRDTALA